MSASATPEAGDILVTREEAARRLSLSVVEIDRLRRRSELIAKRHGRKVLFAVAELRRWADNLPCDEPR